jgi:hypothetical protein
VARRAIGLNSLFSPSGARGEQVILKFLHNSTDWSGYRRIDGAEIEVEVLWARSPEVPDPG